MKYKTNKRAIMSGYTNVIRVSYCGLQTLLRHENETAYITRREGWAADVYDFGNTAIVTGYAPFGNIAPGYDVVHAYETRAQKIAYNYDLTWQEQRDTLRDLITAFIAEVTQ